MERYVRRFLLVSTGAVALTLAAHLALLFWSRHEFTQAESVVANHSRNLATGFGIYHRLDRYPYTVTAYMPCFYLLQAAAYRLGLPIFLAGRIFSFAALLGVLVVARRLLALLTEDRLATWTGTLLIASTANLAAWATVGQIDMLGVFFSLFAVYQYFRYRKTRKPRPLVWTGCFLALALSTKQTMLAAAGTICLFLLIEERRRAAILLAAIGVPLATLVLALNHWTAGGFVENVLWANLNPFSFRKLLEHLRYLAPAAGGLIVIALAGAPAAFRRGLHPLYMYLAASALLLLATSSKIGSDLNYHLETMVVLGICAGWTLHQLRFFPLSFRGSPSAVTLLQIPLLFHIVLNLVISGRVLLEKAVSETLHRAEYAQLQPYLAADRGRILSVQLGPLVQAGRRLEVEPLIYTLLVEAGRLDPEPVLRDLSEKRFGLVLLYEDVFQPRNGPRPPELPSLPPSQLEAIRRNYRFVEHIDGPFLQGDYLYSPTGN